MPLAAEALKIPEYDFKHEGILGKFDEAQLQRGFQVFKEVCSTCHSLSYIHFRNLEDLGYTEQEVKAFATNIRCKINCRMLTVKCLCVLAGHLIKFPGRTKMKQRRVPRNGGAYPPDLSLMTKARANGSDYIRALFLGLCRSTSWKGDSSRAIL